MVLTAPCLTDEDLAAFIDGMVPLDKRERVIQHLASCPRCREIYAATLQFQEESRPEEVAGLTPLPFVPKRPARRWLAPALPAAAAAAFAAVLLPMLLSNPSRFDPAGLVADLDLGHHTAVAEKATADPTKRGPNQGQGLETRSRDFQTGVRLIGLVVNLESASAPRAENILSDLDGLADESLLEDKDKLKELWAACRQAVKENSRPAVRKALARVWAEEKEIRESTDREKIPEFRFGEWTEASRLAAVGRISAYFQRRDFRRYLGWIQKNKDAELPEGAAKALREIDRTLSGRPLTADDFARLDAKFTEIINAYRRSDELGDPTDPTLR